MTTSIILGSALALLIIIFIIRELEIRKQRRLYVTVILSGLDPICERCIAWGVRSVANVYLFSHFLVIKTCVPIVQRVGKHLHFKMYHTLRETHKMLEGKKKLKNGGSVNFFLHSVEEHKKDASKHFKLEDTH